MPEWYQTGEKLGIAGSQGGAKIEILAIAAGWGLSVSCRKTELKWFSLIVENPLWA